MHLSRRLHKEKKRVEKHDQRAWEWWSSEDGKKAAAIIHSELLPFAMDHLKYVAGNRFYLGVTSYQAPGYTVKTMRDRPVPLSDQDALHFAQEMRYGIYHIVGDFTLGGVLVEIEKIKSEMMAMAADEEDLIELVNRAQKASRSAIAGEEATPTNS